MQEHFLNTNYDLERRQEIRWPTVFLVHPLLLTCSTRQVTLKGCCIACNERIVAISGLRLTTEAEPAHGSSLWCIVH